MKSTFSPRRFLPFFAIVCVGAMFPSAADAASISGSNYTWGYQTAAGTNTLSSGDTVNVGSGSSNYFLVGVGYNSTSGSGILNASAATSFNVNVGNFYVGVNAFNNPVGTGTGGGGATSSGTLNLGVNNTITAATKLVIGGADVEANTGVAGGNNGTITTANGGTTTIHTPLMQLGTAKGDAGTFTLGSNATLNLGTTGNRTALDLGIKLTDFNGANRNVAGTMNLGASGGVANLNLSRLRLSYNTIYMTGGTLHGNLALSDSASNTLNIVGTGNVVSIGVASGSAGSFSGGTANGLLTIGDLHADSYIESTNNGTAILIGAKPSGATATVNGTMDFKKGSVTIKTTGAAIAGGNGTANTSRLNLGETGMVKLKAGASSTDWINGLTVAEIKSGGVTIHTNSYDLGISQAFSGAGGLTKDGAGTLTLSSVNTYTGATNVTGGTLVIDGTNTATTGDVTVADGARFGGNGATPAELTVQANGKWLVGISDWTGSAGTGFTDLTVGSLVLDGAWTLDVTSLTAYANFSHATKTFPILTATGGITGFNAGNVTVVTHDSFTGTGTWSVQKTGNTLELVYTATPPPVDDYAAWDEEYTDADLSDKTADNDGDGLSNFQEYAFGLDPTSGASVNPIIDISMLKTTGVFSYSRRAGTDLSFTVLTSDDLQNWIPVADPAEQPGPVVDGVQIIEVDLTGMEFTDPFFIRVKAE